MILSGVTVSSFVPLLGPSNSQCLAGNEAVRFRRGGGSSERQAEGGPSAHACDAAPNASCVRLFVLAAPARPGLRCNGRRARPAGCLRGGAPSGTGGRKPLRPPVVGAHLGRRILALEWRAIRLDPRPLGNTAAGASLG